MKSPSRALSGGDSKSKRSCLYAMFPAVSLICAVIIFTSLIFSSQLRLSSWKIDAQQTATVDKCKNQCRPKGSEALPAGIVSSTSSFDLRPLWDPPTPRKRGHHTVEPAEGAAQDKLNASSSLFAMAVGIKQKDLVDKMVKKFLESNFTVMLFHYDGAVDGWNDLEWNSRVIHVSVNGQGKWWFAKRFLHPDIVEDYDYIFLWDEDLGVQYFHPDRYISIIKLEGLEISQPALDPKNSEVHHQITARLRRSTVHRRTFRAGNDGKGCDKNSTAPPCTGWIEMMAPVFSRAAWRCVWYMIQNDLIHAWGLDMQLGYCAQGDRTKSVGVVDSEYIIHYNRPTLGGVDQTVLKPQEKDHRVDVRRLSYRELDIFRKRWEKAVKEDECWVDPFPQSE
ncbi:hypothetical protein LR48_Vigan845s006200 [Vigna angularis]|uniref:Uncharacterized protein n=3 Tax=Phaseolus angularis TaxID=3914 RepID=A0A0L9TIS4_PHAAN|nr:uncharacterized protein LOC108323073 isoform X1 [Vigna angularis]KOM30034.1 hypothetical protein LR48_Vigan845s006200 [Vigna angularis]BAT94894.1 hypothetical protein VIGAN_08154400 [Vigna angularis var. angularis]